MAHTYEELKTKNVAELREIAAGIDHEAVKGFTQLNKDHLLAAICTALGIDMHQHHQVKGINKTDIKAKIKELKKRRDDAISAHDRTQLKQVRRHIHRLKREIHKATV
ncbi:MAG: hypothetical protein M3362_09690 [Acidobacteriota bacterium]|nr:hypothetical protein [Acidobacteriota bacterium]